MPAKQARGRVSSSANQMSPPSALLNALNELNGTTQRFSGSSHRAQCLLCSFAETSPSSAFPFRSERSSLALGDRRHGTSRLARLLWPFGDHGIEQRAVDP